MKKLICALLIAATLLFAGCTPDVGEQITGSGRFLVVEKHEKLNSIGTAYPYFWPDPEEGGDN